MVVLGMTELARGRCVSVELVAGGLVRGRVHNVDRQAGLAVLEELDTRKMVVVALGAVTKVTTLPATPSNWPEKPMVGKAGAAVLRAAAVEYARLPPPGVGADGVTAYEALAKTLPCKWDDDGGIQVFDGVVRVAPPYRIADISR